MSIRQYFLLPKLPAIWYLIVYVWQVHFSLIVINISIWILVCYSLPPHLTLIGHGNNAPPDIDWAWE